MTAGEASAWISDTGLVCFVAGGLEGSLALAVTTGLRIGTETYAGSYDLSSISSVSGMNVGTTGGGSLSLRGAGFGSRR